ncbi:hypothetical protein Syn7502_00914 [Synechococcus sp. PCC 7502]|uniref:lipid-A-disaccharide synthase-related protein n=1 Tax=Synechococcus sp. PCC 7502 TaxID=1173263 RepID=UPI00029FF069|nr:lipid-A-disaccharide synthase-related protein [Synechococcus sp. PCC 7502]AFY73034.1 hypothetical protein Syn7502_00914 [Synechococcus sp. PCC 7502]
MSEITEILCVSNGHGEDQIAARVCTELSALKPKRLSITALPLVGVGHAYRSAQIAIATEVNPKLPITQKLPTGGFSRMDSKELLKDIRGGLIGLTWRQLQLIWRWSCQNPQRLILAVGDIVPLVLAWLPTWQGGCNYVFIATAKSEYYWRDRHGKLANVPKPLGGSTFYPWERSLISNRHCKAAFVRDQLTAEFLQDSFKLPVQYLGNPMMDGLEPSGLDLGIKSEEWVMAILPGSRTPEAYENWATLLVAIQGIMRKLTEPINFLAAIAPDLALEKLGELLIQKGWLQLDLHTYVQNLAKLHLVTQGYGDCLHLAHLGLAMAGTATEQLVGLGKPVITIMGRGPQFTPSFARDQARLLGQSIILVENPTQVNEAIALLLNNPDYFQIAVINGKERMGEAGAAQRIAKYILA